MHIAEMLSMQPLRITFSKVLLESSQEESLVG